MAEIARRDGEKEQLIWALDDRFRSPPGKISGIAGSRLETSHLYTITQAHTWRLAPWTEGSNSLRWTHNIPIPTKRFVRIVLLLTQKEMTTRETLTITYIPRTKNERQVYKVRFNIGGGEIKFWNYEGTYITVTNQAPWLMDEVGGEIEIFLDLERKRYESVRIGRERFPIRAPAQTMGNTNADTGVLFEVEYEKTGPASGEVYIDKVEIFQS